MTEETTVLSTAEKSAGMVLLEALLDEIRHLQSPWQNTPEEKQNQTIYRLRARVETAVNKAVRDIACNGFNHIVAEVDGITIKDGTKATLNFGGTEEERVVLYRHARSRVIVVFADAKEFTDGIDQIKADADQPELPLEAEGDGTGTDTPEAGTEAAETVTPAETTPVRQAETIRSASVLVGKLNEGWILRKLNDNTYEAVSPNRDEFAAVWLAAARRVIDDGTAVVNDPATNEWLIPQQQAA